jgi:hypothetical protein
MEGESFRMKEDRLAPISQFQRLVASRLRGRLGTPSLRLEVRNLAVDAVLAIGTPCAFIQRFPVDTPMSKDRGATESPRAVIAEIGWSELRQVVDGSLESAPTDEVGSLVANADKFLPIGRTVGVISRQARQRCGIPAAMSLRPRNMAAGGAEPRGNE